MHESAFARGELFFAFRFDLYWSSVSEPLRWQFGWPVAKALRAAVAAGSE